MSDIDPGLAIDTQPRLADDLLTGARPIAHELGWSEREVYSAHARGVIPSFNLGRAVCARRSTLREHIARLESGSLKKAS